jgi:hypothetical protein
MTRSMGIALQDLSLDRLFVVYPGPRRYRIREQVTALPLREFADPESVRELAIG